MGKRELAADEGGGAGAVEGGRARDDGEGGDEVGRGGPVGGGRGRAGEVEVEEEGGGDFGTVDQSG